MRVPWTSQNNDMFIQQDKSAGVRVSIPTLATTDCSQFCTLFAFCDLFLDAKHECTEYSFGLKVSRATFWAFTCKQRLHADNRGRLQLLVCAGYMQGNDHSTQNRCSPGGSKANPLYTITVLHAKKAEHITHPVLCRNLRKFLTWPINEY